MQSMTGSMELDEVQAFRISLLEGVRAAAVSSGTYLRDAFVKEAADRLIVADEFPDLTPCVYAGRGKRRRELVVDGFVVDDADLDSSVSIMLADLRDEAGMPSLTQTQAQALLDKGLHFIEEALEGRLHEELEPSTPACDLATWLYEHRSSLNSIRTYLVTDAVLSSRLKKLPERSVRGVRVECHLWDVVRFFRAQGGGGRESIDINLGEFSAEGVPALLASVGDEAYQSYLCVLRGDILASLYDRYGGRLLEGNVRSFLSVRVKVNAGMQNTISVEPTRFFAYNNGITATAAAVVAEEHPSGVRLMRVRDLQIVNGGQTTASLFHASRKVEAREHLKSIYVQMKLSVVPPEISPELVSKIARFANTQNKVSEADLFSNHPFHLRVSEIAARTWAPASGDGQVQTRWFYERARGEYVNEQVKLSPARKRTFLLQNPKDQLITKTDLAKFENSWDRRPHIVSRGAQKNFAEFAEVISERWSALDANFNERWFQQAVVRAIIFRTAESVVSEQDWYDGGYRANIVTYAIARLAEELSATNRALDYQAIWKRQSLSSAFRVQLGEAARLAHEVIHSPPEGMRNVSEWAKKPACWDRLKTQKLGLFKAFQDELVSLSDEKENVVDARKTRKIDDGIEAQALVVSLGSLYWRRVLAWHKSSGGLSLRERNIITAVTSSARAFLPTEAQSLVLKDVHSRLQSLGIKV